MVCRHNKNGYELIEVDLIKMRLHKIDFNTNRERTCHRCVPLDQDVYA